MEKQIKSFHFIIEGMRFFIDCSDFSHTGFKKAGIEQYKNEFLNCEFLDIQGVK